MVLFPLAFRVEAPSTFKELLTVMPYKPLPVQVTVEQMCIRDRSLTALKDSRQA